MQFNVHAIDARQQVVSLTLEAVSEAGALEMARLRGLSVFSVQGSGSFAFSRIQIWKKAKFPTTLFSVELASLLEAGLNLVEALSTLNEKNSRDENGKVLAGILTAIQRGPFQSSYVGYWIDEKHAGNGYMPESVVVLCRFAFDELQLHRVQIAIIPRNQASRRVVEKLDIRDEGIAVRYLEINGVWEDHVRYAITSEEWDERRDTFLADWID